MPERGPRRPFSPREEEIADGIYHGLSYKEIGARLINLHTGKLGVSEETVAHRVELMALQFDAYYEHELKQHFTPREIIWLYTRYRRLHEQALERLEADAKARFTRS